MIDTSGPAESFPAAPAQYFAPECRFPDFLCIGAQKAGTTWLFENIRAHPSIWLPPVKELQYFNDVHIPGHRAWTQRHRRQHGVRALETALSRPRDKRDYQRIARIADIVSGNLSDDWYGRIFKLARPNQICGEMTPEYSLLPPAGIAHVVRLMPKVKIIFLMRDPIARTWSHIRMLARVAGTPDTESLIKIANYKDIVDRSDYSAIIHRWSTQISQDRVFVSFMDDIVAEPERVLTELCRFFEIEYQDRYFARRNQAVHVGEALEMPPEIFDILKRRLKPAYISIKQLYPDVGGKWYAAHYE